MKTNGKIQLYPFLRVAVFLIAGIVAGTSLYGTVPLPVWIGLAAITATAAVTARRHCMVQSWMTFAAIMSAGAVLACAQLMKVDMDFADRAVEYEAVVTSRPVVKGKTVRCDMTVTKPGGRTFKVKASFMRDARADSLRTGCGIRAFSVLQKPANYAGSTFDYRRYLLYHGYSGTTFIPKWCWQGNRTNLSGMPLMERARLAALIFRDKLLRRYAVMGLDGQGYAVLSAMTLGDKTAVTKALADDYSVSGASHVLALSGLHLGIIFAVLTFIFSRLRIKTLSLALVICAIWAYVFVVGMSPSVMRSAVMLTVYTFVNLLNRDRLSLNTLSLTAVILLSLSPLDFYDVGFQMSFMSVLFIILLYRPLYRALPMRLRRLWVVDKVWQMLCVSLTAQLGVAPLVALYFGRFSCYFLLTNLIVVPMATLILYGAVLLLATGFIPQLQGYVAAVLHCLTEWLNASVSLIASWPGASIDGLHVNVFMVICFYIMTAAACAAVRYSRLLFWDLRKPLDGFRFPEDGDM